MCVPILMFQFQLEVTSPGNLKTPGFHLTKLINTQQLLNRLVNWFSDERTQDLATCRSQAMAVAWGLRFRRLCYSGTWGAALVLECVWRCWGSTWATIEIGGWNIWKYVETWDNHEFACALPCQHDRQNIDNHRIVLFLSLLYFAFLRLQFKPQVCWCPRVAARWRCNQEISRPSHQVKLCVSMCQL